MDIEDTAALPAYSEFDADGLPAWVDSLVPRAEELGLPLTHPRFDSDIVWIRRPVDNVTTGRMWRRGVARTDDDAAKGSSAAADDLAAREAAADTLMTQKRIIETFFHLVRSDQTGAVGLFVAKGLVSPDVTDGEGYNNGMGRQGLREGGGSGATETGDGDIWNGATPLLAAVDAGDAAMVRVLVHLGADVNRMARPPGLRPLSGRGWRPHDDALDRLVRRTPLMLAAAQGRLALARLFFEELGADDALVAPDGQIALRLAAAGKHREIVALLPSRRGGAWARFGTRHARAMQRARRAAGKIAYFGKVTGQVLFWYLPKFLVWDVPKEAGRYAWAKRRAILPALGRALLRVPRFVKAVGELLVELTKALGRLVTRIPAALKVAAQWVGRALQTLGRALAHAAVQVASALHTALAAVWDFFRTITLKDVLNGFKAAGRAVFVEFPQAVGRTFVLLGEYTYRALKALFGCGAWVIKEVTLLLLAAVLYVPKQLWKIVAAVGSSIGGGLHEVVVWVNPKAV